MGTTVRCSSFCYVILDSVGDGSSRRSARVIQRPPPTMALLRRRTAWSPTAGHGVISARCLPTAVAPRLHQPPRRSSSNLDEESCPQRLPTCRSVGEAGWVGRHEGAPKASFKRYVSNVSGRSHSQDTSAVTSAAARQGNEKQRQPGGSAAAAAWRRMEFGRRRKGGYSRAEVEHDRRVSRTAYNCAKPSRVAAGRCSKRQRRRGVAVEVRVARRSTAECAASKC